MIMNRCLYIFFIFSCLFSSIDEKYGYEVKISQAKSDNFDFGMSIKINVDDGHYMSSAIVSNDQPFAAVSSIIWPENKGCYDDKGKEFLFYNSPTLMEKYYDEEECVNNNGQWIFGNWISDLKEYHNAPIFDSISIIEETPNPSLKEGINIQRNKFEIYQEYILAKGLKSGVYEFKAKFDYQICQDKGLCFPKTDLIVENISIAIGDSGNYIINFDRTQNTIQDSNLNNIDSKENNYCGEIQKSKTVDSEFSFKDLMFSFFTAMLAGLVAIITPCVFPMIPMTVAFFSKDTKKGSKESIKTGLLFGFCIIFIFTIVGVLLSAIASPSLANELATSATANIIFAIIFLIFAISFFGYFEIRIPNKFLNKINKKADGGGVLGIFFMALTLVLVSFSCTGPIVGTIIVDAFGGEFFEPLVVMFGFSLAFAIPFALFAIFPSWLESMPQSGDWLNSVKIVLGFLELALALKFLSMPDQAYHWGILNRQVFLFIWILIFFSMGIYISGIIKLFSGKKLPKYGFVRVVSLLSTFAFCVYMLWGYVGNPIPALAGIIPPAKGETLDVKYADVLHLPPGFKGYFDYEEGIEAAKSKGKPLFIDFTGHGCFNCRRMEENVWSNPEVKKILDEDYVILALYVDDRTPLLGDDNYQTLGEKNFKIQFCNFNQAAQPYYVLLHPNHPTEPLVEPIGYDTNIQNFVDFLNNGKKEFEKK